MSDRQMHLFIPELSVSQTYHNLNEPQGEYFQYVHWRLSFLSTIHDESNARNTNALDDGCPLKKYKPTHNNYKAFDDFVRKLVPPFFVKPPEPQNEKDVIYLHQVSEENKTNLPTSGGITPTKSGCDLVRVIMIEIPKQK